jgi:hypothetical protein
MNRTHYLQKVGPPLTDSNWVDAVHRDFNRPVRCGRMDWAAASDKPADVDCRDCLKKMTPDERRGGLRAVSAAP